MSETQEERQEQQLIGDIIRQAREKRNVSVKIVAQHTKISSTNLEALEANDLASLPNKAYVKGYVKSCAKLLGLDEDQCLEILDQNYDSIEKPIRVKQQKQEEKVKQERENNELIFKMAGVLIVVIVIVVLLTRQGSNPDKEEIVQETPVEQTEEVENITPVVLSDTTPLKPETTPTIIVTPEVIATAAPTPIATATPKVVEEKKEETKPDEEDKKEEVTLRPIRGTLYGFDSEMSEDQINEWLPSNYRVAPTEGKQSVFINATEGDTWLTYQEDGGDIKKFVLKQGQKLLLNGEEVLLFLGNYRVTKIFLNNKPLAISSRSGVKSLVFPQEKASEHFYPLFIYNDDGSVMNSKTYNANKSN